MRSRKYLPSQEQADSDATKISWRRWAEIDDDEQRRITRMVARTHPLDSDLFGAMSRLMERVRVGGDEAVREVTREFDHLELGADLVLDVDDLAHKHGNRLSNELRAALDLGVERVRAYNALLMERNCDFQSDVGADRMGQLIRPVNSAGLFVPAGKGSFPSVLLHLGAPAVGASVSELLVMTPPDKRWGVETDYVDPATVHIAQRLGIRRILVANGPACIAAATFGTDSVQPVDMIAGPGSQPIETCQRIAQAAGLVIASGLGPSDSFIIAQSGIDPEIIAADFLSEAEHGADSSVVLLSDDAELLTSAVQAATRILADLPEPRRSYARSAVAKGGAFLVKGIAEAIDISNAYAPEHLLLLLHANEAALPRITNAGTVVIGPYTPFVASSYTAGTPATLPTTGAARTSSGVTALSYVKRIAVLELGRSTMQQMAGAIALIAEHEGFPAHARAAQIDRG